MAIQGKSQTAAMRLESFLNARNLPSGLSGLTPDASAREYFRIKWNGGTAVACVYPEAFSVNMPFLDTAALFLEAGLPVAKIFAHDGDSGIVIQEDLGDRLLQSELGASDSQTRDALLDRAIGLIARIQHATDLANKRGSVASKKRFDRKKLLWELEFFKTHYLYGLANDPLTASLEKAVDKEFADLAEEMESFAMVLTHRDFHAANLMIDSAGEMRIIDHQDARMGPAAYDLVSLTLDRITEIPKKEWIVQKQALLLGERESLGLPLISAREFSYEFHLVSVQRCLKAIGTFSNQARNLGKDRYHRFIDPMFKVVYLACEAVNRFPAVREMIRRRQKPDRGRG